jgi:hypothetical protein
MVSFYPYEFPVSCLPLTLSLPGVPPVSGTLRALARAPDVCYFFPFAILVRKRTQCSRRLHPRRGLAGPERP